MFSKACEYAIKATLFVAHQSDPGGRVSLKYIAREIGSPEAFTAKILQELVKHDILDSQKGPAGGFSFDRNRIKKLNLSDIVLAIDGEKIYTGCGLGLHECSAEFPCPVHDQFKSIKEKTKSMLETTSIHDLILGLKQGITFLK